MDLSLWLTFVAASTALLLIPGPTILLVMSYALSQGRRVAVASATGVALGDAVAMSASLAGLGALAYALLADRMRAGLRRPAVLRGMTRGGGVALMAMGVVTVLTRRAA